MKKKFIVAGAAALVGVLAVSSGASAAQHYLITSSSQIKNGTISLFDLTPNARKALQGHAGAMGARGPQGPAGVQGAKGDRGPAGPAAAGAQGPQGDAGAPGAKGDAGSQGLKGDKGETGAPGVKGDPGAQGPQGPQGDKGDKGDPAPVLSSGNWGIINRNTIGSPSAFLRSGPFTAPFGKGSLNLIVGGSTEKAAYGNEVDFNGQLVSDLTNVGFRVYTTGEDVGAGNGTPNMPSITFEIDPNVQGISSHFSSLVYMPDNSAANTWSPYIDATTTGHWGLTGKAFAGTQCDINGARCTFAEIKAYLADNNNGTPAKIFTVAIGKGRDFSWQGAVDGLRINGTVYDFEETGVAEHLAA